MVYVAKKRNRREAYVERETQKTWFMSQKRDIEERRMSKERHRRRVAREM